VGPRQPKTLDRYGQIPRYLATWGGSEGVMKILLGGDDVRHNGAHEEGYIPPCCAAVSGNEVMAKVLLRLADANSNQLSKNDQAPLSCVAFGEYKGAVEIGGGRGDANLET